MTLAEEVSELNKDLHLLRTASSGECGSTNDFGDKQLQVDVEADELIFSRLRACSAVSVASSEEQPELVRLTGSGYGVAFDPLDGSSVLGANFAVGSIFGIWPGDNMLGRPGRKQVAAMYAVYGPQTLLLIARPRTANNAPIASNVIPAGAAADEGTLAMPASSALSSTHIVQEFLLAPDGEWQLRRSEVLLSDQAAPRRVFAPANLRASGENKEYAALVAAWVAAHFTLRYTGGMVPDVHHILAKNGGVFCNPVSASAPPKLRLLYECAPLAFVMEAAGGASHDGRGSLLDQVVTSCSNRSIICLGSVALVQQSIPALAAGLLPAPAS